MAKFFLFMAFVGSVVGGLILLTGFASPKSAPQEAAIAAVACAAAILPYVAARVVQIWAEMNAAETRMTELLMRLDMLTGQNKIIEPSDHA